MAIGTALAIAGGLAKFIPIVKDLFDDGDESVAEKVVNIAETLTGQTGDSAIRAIESDPNIALEFKKAVMSDAHVESRLEVKRLNIINKTIQVEANSKNWWTSGWRPFIGFCTGIAFIGVVILVGIISYEAVKVSEDPMNMIPQIIFNFSTLFAVPGAILGIASHHRGRMQRGGK